MIFDSNEQKDLVLKFFEIASQHASVPADHYQLAANTYKALQEAQVICEESSDS